MVNGTDDTSGCLLQLMSIYLHFAALNWRHFSWIQLCSEFSYVLLNMNEILVVSDHAVKEDIISIE